jgi:hypothetical protein
VCEVMEYASYVRNTFTKTQFIFDFHPSQVFYTKQHLCFRSCMGVFLDGIVDWWVKHSGYTACNMITNHYKCNGACVNKDHWQGAKMTNAAASGSRENYRMVG